MKQKEIWLVNLDPTIGAEIKKTRPCVILNSNLIGKLPLKIIAPVTDFKPQYEAVPWMVKLTPNNTNSLTKTSVIDLVQVRSVSEIRLVKRIGTIDDKEFRKCKEALSLVFE